MNILQYAKWLEELGVQREALEVEKPLYKDSNGTVHVSQICEEEMEEIREPLAELAETEAHSCFNGFSHNLYNAFHPLASAPTMRHAARDIQAAATEEPGAALLQVDLALRSLSGASRQQALREAVRKLYEEGCRVQEAILQQLPESPVQRGDHLYAVEGGVRAVVRIVNTPSSNWGLSSQGARDAAEYLSERLLRRTVGENACLCSAEEARELEAAADVLGLKNSSCRLDVNENRAAVEVAAVLWSSEGTFQKMEDALVAGRELAGRD